MNHQPTRIFESKQGIATFLMCKIVSIHINFMRDLGKQTSQVWRLSLQCNDI